VNKQKNNRPSRRNPNFLNPFQTGIASPHLHLNSLIPQLTLVNVRINFVFNLVDRRHFVMRQIILSPNVSNGYQSISKKIACATSANHRRSWNQSNSLRNRRGNCQSCGQGLSGVV
jgi:hypothetical protein